VTALYFAKPNLKTNRSSVHYSELKKEKPKKKRKKRRKKRGRKRRREV